MSRYSRTNNPLPLVCCKRLGLATLGAVTEVQFLNRSRLSERKGVVGGACSNLPTQLLVICKRFAFRPALDGWNHSPALQSKSRRSVTLKSAYLWNIPLPVRIAAKKFRWCWTYPCASKLTWKIAKCAAIRLRSVTPCRTTSWRSFRPGLWDDSGQDKCRSQFHMSECEKRESRPLLSNAWRAWLWLIAAGYRCNPRLPTSARCFGRRWRSRRSDRACRRVCSAGNSN